ncbi:MOSC domain-containing protein YiiM [Rubricella aquisinus]|uniref:MOSC domain-containing protein YiiM n=1 Tax=Rubricella aquisinus TaxID=2028108 RepID=A0A840WIL5_9RHOB|nr:MOSC domain-containing protein [Rubricella aquisinus]MBB5514949.1 MOSC domain-containing protein YiiM [Rubricella aquisinus]
MDSLKEVMERHHQLGQVAWIGLRPARLAPVVTVNEVAVRLTGLEGDHRARPGKRAVTLIQAEHLPVIRALSGFDADFADLRRNFAVRGINLLALRDREVEIGTALLRITGICAPCTRMERLMGPGGYNAMRGHGGMTAEVLREGVIGIGDAVGVD